MIPDDVTLLARRIDMATRAANQIRRHLPDLHALCYDPYHTDTEPDRSGFESRPPPGYRTEPTRAQVLWSRISLQVAQIEATLTGLDRAMTALFYAGSTSPEPSRGSLISAAEHDRLLANQRTHGDSPARLVDQPRHPGTTAP